MVKVAAAGGVPGASRLDRRKARTRQALIDAAVRLIAEGRGERASIAEITEEADIGFGLLRLRERHPERVDETSVDQLTEACLRLLGVPGSEAARLVASCLPPVGAVSR